jgi:hypothetical protein
MRLFTVHLPPSGGATQPALDGAVFVRDGFHFWAFVLGPLWCVWRGLWLPALVIIALSAVLVGIGRALHLSPETQIMALIVPALLVGFEAANLRGFGLRRRGYVDRGSIVASDLSEAEAIFFRQAASPQAGPWPGAMPPAPERGVPKRGPAGEDVVGLFPEYRGR